LIESADEVVAEVDETKKKANHIFQALQYLRKLCNHPLLVVTPQAPNYKAITSKLKSSNLPPIENIHHAPKLQALK
jgi:TATA-binding protein-associated factor